jgi:PAS domain S-box-containing protein
MRFQDNKNRENGTSGSRTDPMAALVNQGEENARQSYERLRLALGASSACIWERDTRTDEVFLSEGWATLIGAPPGETRTTLQALIAIVHPEDVDASVGMATDAVKGLRDEYAVEHRVRTCAGEWRWILSRGKVTERGADGRALRLSGINLDIHGRKSAELALAESEARYRSLIALSQHTYWETDAEHRLTGESDGAAIVAALPVAQQVGKRFWEAPSTIPDEAGWRELRLKFDRHEPFRHFEVSRRMDGGGERHNVLSGEPRFDHAGRFLGYRGFSRDVTDRVIASRRAREAYDRVRAAIENLDEVVALTDAEERFVMVNRAFLKMSGVIADFARPGWTYEQYLRAGIAAGNIVAALGREEAWLEERMALRRKASQQMELQLASGQWLLLRDQKLADGGTITWGLDISDRKRAEEALATSEARFRAVFERSNAGIAMWGVDGIYIAANTAYCEFVGYSADELVGKIAAGELRLPGDDEGFDLTGRMVRGEVAFTSRDRRYRRRDGSEVWGRTTVAAVKGNDGMPEHFVSVVIDITEARKVRERNERINIELEERVAERTVELRSALKELDAFAYSVSHDLRAPVGAVSGIAHLLRTAEAPRLSDDGRRLLGMIEGNAERMVALIDGLLRLSQLGRGAIRRIPLSMEDLAREVLRDVAEGTRAEIRIAQLPRCDGDPAVLRQVWANLIGNALKYSRTRPAPQVDVGWDAECNAYFVRDNGVGFDMQYASKLFGAFERLHGESEFEGCGIGLAIVQRILDRHGGKIWADAGPDRGATFWFSVPAAASAKKR